MQLSCQVVHVLSDLLAIFFGFVVVVETVDGLDEGRENVQNVHGRALEETEIECPRNRFAGLSVARSAGSAPLGWSDRHLRYWPLQRFQCSTFVAVIYQFSLS